MKRLCLSTARYLFVCSLFRFSGHLNKRFMGNGVFTSVVSFLGIKQKNKNDKVPCYKEMKNVNGLRCFCKSTR